jgi:pentose-5-phosphate-3-epimerase
MRANTTIKLSPALITITDGRMDTPAATLQQEVITAVNQLLDHDIRSFHLDINFDDYSGFGSTGPDRNTAIFTPEFAADLYRILQAREAELTIHLLTDYPLLHLNEYPHARVICFQLDVFWDFMELTALVDQIHALGAWASPVIETVGTDHLTPSSPAEVRAQLELLNVDMLTFQAAGTAARSNVAAGAFARDQVKSYIDCLAFDGPIQIQGGITIETIAEAVKLGAEYLVCGTQVFRHPNGLTPPQVINLLLEQIKHASITS